jgi:hypothetical protein
MRRVFSPGPRPDAGSNWLSSAREGPNTSPASAAFAPAPNPVTSR